MGPYTLLGIKTRKFMLICIFGSNLPLDGHCINPFYLLLGNIIDTSTCLPFNSLFTTYSKLYSGFKTGSNHPFTNGEKTSDSQLLSKSNTVSFSFVFTYLLSNLHFTSSQLKSLVLINTKVFVWLVFNWWKYFNISKC